MKLKVHKYVFLALLLLIFFSFAWIFYAIGSFWESAIRVIGMAIVTCLISASVLSMKERYVEIPLADGKIGNAIAGIAFLILMLLLVVWYCMNDGQLFPG